MILLFGSIKFHHKTNIEKIINFALYTLVQNLTFSKKANNFMKNSARVPNYALNDRSFFALFACIAKSKILL